MTDASAPVRCGRIRYTNDLPIYAAFDLGVLEFPGTLVAAVPSELNRALLAGELDISPISSMFYAQHPEEFATSPDICIGSRGEAKSIQCISPQHPRELGGRRIAVTKESATGRALFDVICRTSYGFVPALEPSDDPFAEYQRGGTPCLLIGDAAIDGALAARQDAYDVGKLWHELTGADMVYAVWATRKDYVIKEAERLRSPFTDVLRALSASVEFGRAHMDQVIALAQSQRPRPTGFYESYYQALNYAYDARAQMGFSRFCTLAQACGVLDPALAIPAKPEFVYNA